MLIRSILTIAVLGSFVFGAAANAETRGILSPENTVFTAPGDVPAVAPPGTPWAVVGR